MADTQPDLSPVKKLAILATDTAEALGAQQKLISLYGQFAPREADVIIALGGDGFMLEVLHRFHAKKIPIYGMNRGSIGFLMNSYHEDSLMQRISHADRVTVHPLNMVARTRDGEEIAAMAVNEVSLLRQTRQTAKLRIVIDGRERLPELICDGALVSTPAGSTAYNLSAHGPIIPLNANILALTPISAFRPRRWRGALLPDHVRIRIEVMEAAKRPVSAVADYTEVRDICHVDIVQDLSVSMTLLFDPDHNYEERVIREQFVS